MNENLKIVAKRIPLVYFDFLLGPVSGFVVAVFASQENVSQPNVTI